MKKIKRLTVFVVIGFSTFLIGESAAKFSRARAQNAPALSPWEVLLSFENQDLEGVQGERLNTLTSAVEAITGEHDTDSFRPYDPALFRSITNFKGEKRYLLVEEGPLVSIPGASRLRVHVFDPAGHLLSMDDFNAGWRMDVTSMRVRKNDQIGREVLVVDSEHCFGTAAATHFYALIGNRLELVYATAVIKGEWMYRPYPNSYGSSGNSVGPRITRSADEWEMALTSSDNAEVLAALMWIGGRHSDGTSQLGGVDEDKTDVQSFATLRARDSVQQKLKELSEVNEQADTTKFWVKYAAIEALNKDNR